MKDLSLYILDISQNSIAAGCRNLALRLTEDEEGLLTLVVADDGKGMAPEFLAQVMDPFTTTRTTRKVGMGIPLLMLCARQTGGDVHIESELGVGTTLTATFQRRHIDCPPLGSLAETMALIIQGAPDVEYEIVHRVGEKGYEFTTKEVREALGPGVSLAEPDVFAWLREYLTELEESIET